VLRRLSWRLRNGFWRRWYGWSRIGRIGFILLALVAGAGTVAMLLAD
jgi:hypothetical protein